MRIDVSGHQFVFPPQCACCGGVANTTWTVSASRSRGKRVVHTTTRCWDFPYCGHCVDHALTYERAAGKSALVVLGAVVLALIIHSAWSLLPLGAGVWLAIVVFQNIRRQAEDGRSATCVAAGPALAYLGFEGTVNRFDVVGPYAWSFIGANANKLVNETQEMREHVDAIAPQRRSKNVQRPRRFES